MNSYKLNGLAGHLTRTAICKGLNINFTDLYKTVKQVNNDNTIETCDGRKFILKLTEIKNANN